MISGPAPSPSKLRVLVATPLGEGGRGGIDRIMDEVRRQLAIAGPVGVEVSFLTTRGQGHIALSPLYLAAAIARLASAKLAGRVDVLHVNLSSHGSTRRKRALCRAAEALGVPYVIHLHGSRFRQFWLDAGPAEAAGIGRMFRRAARVIALGQVWKAFLSEREPEIAGRIDILPNATQAPVPTPRRDSGAGPTTVLFLGQVGPRKGTPQLVDAFGVLRSRDGWRGVIAGDGQVAETRDEVARLGLSDRVEVLGWVGPETVDRLLAAADILVLPSFDENLPMSVIEGMAHGLAVVATPVGAVEDIIKDGETGLLTPPGDPARLAETLERLLGDAALRRRLGDAARDFHTQNLEIFAYLDRLIAIWRAAARRST